MHIRVETALGIFGAEANDDGLCKIWLPSQIEDMPQQESDYDFPWDFGQQIKDYLAGKRTQWNLPFVLEGTPVQLSVWYACKDIAFGETLTYDELAQKAGYPGQIQAVGSAMADNPLPLIIPCHRVLAASGGTDFYGGTPALKAALLSLEGKIG